MDTEQQESLTPEQKRAKRLLNYKKYYQTKCVIRPDMTEEERAAAEAKIKKRRETSAKHRLATKELIANLKAQVVAQPIS